MLKWMPLLIVLILPLAACSSNEFSQYSNEIEEASAKLAEVNKGRFTVETTIQQDSRTVENSTEGKFVMTDEGMNWRTTARIEVTDMDTATQTELIHIDSDTYERFGRNDQEGNYIDQNNDVIEDYEWTRLDQGEDDELNPLNSLLELDLDESMISDISREEGKEGLYLQ